jgi:hypothetical protein
MTQHRWLRFADLVERGIIGSRPGLKKRIDKFGFPPGRLLGPNHRVWTLEEIEAYENAQPIAPKPMSEKARRGRWPKKEEEEPSPTSI